MSRENIDEKFRWKWQKGRIKFFKKINDVKELANKKQAFLARHTPISQPNSGFPTYSFIRPTSIFDCKNLSLLIF